MEDFECMKYTNEVGRDFQLIDRVKPYYRDLATVLMLNSQDEIYIMDHICEDDASRVMHLLSEWLRGANQEKDSRPVTWATLITALKDADIQEEAKILEEHFVEMPQATRRSSLSPRLSKSGEYSGVSSWNM